MGFSLFKKLNALVVVVLFVTMFCASVCAQAESKDDQALKDGQSSLDEKSKDGSSVDAQTGKKEDKAPPSVVLSERNDLLQKGFDANKASQYKQAAEYFKAALEIKLNKKDEASARPDRAGLSREYYLALKNSEQYNEAFIVLKDQGKQFPEDNEIHSELGRLYLANGNPEKSFEEYDGVCRRDPSNREVCMQVAYFYMKRNQHDEAMRSLQGIVEQPGEAPPTLEDEQQEVSELPKLRRRFELVKKGYKAVSEKHYVHSANLFKLALDIELTEEEALKAKPGRVQVELALFYSLRNSDEKEKAEKFLVELGDKHQTHKVIHRELGYYRLGRKEDNLALKEFDGICVRDPKDRDCCLQAAYLYIKRKDEEAAVGTLQTILYHHPDDVLARKQLAYLQLKQEKRDKAIGNFELIVEKEPENKEIHRQLAYLYLDAERKDDAKREIRWVLENEPDQHYLRLELAYLMMEEAKGQLQKVSGQEEDRNSSDRARKSLEGIKRSEEEARRREAASATGSSGSDIFFGDLYTHLFFTARHPNLVFTGRVREGIKVPVVPMKVYLGLRLTRDLRSKGFVTSQIYEDNVMVPMLGVEISPLATVVPTLGFVFYFELGAAIALYDTPAGQSQVELDMRGGVALSYQWQHHKPVKNIEKNLIWPLTFFGEFYTDFAWYYRFDNNWIGFFTIKEGINLLQWGMLLDQLYLRANLKYDVDGVFYNNAIEVGPGMRVMPWDWLHLQFYAEYLMGFYFPRDEENNPYSSPYHDGRIGVLFSYYW